MATTLPHRSNADLLEANYELWRKDPNSVDSTWSAFFEGFELGNLVQKGGGTGGGDGTWQTKVDQLIQAYRSVGHTKVHLNPLSKTAPDAPLLSLETLGFTAKDLDRPASSALFAGGRQFVLRELIAALDGL